MPVVARGAAVPAVAWKSLLALGGGLAALLVAFSDRYGYHRDELYFVAVGARPDWGYVDQPPLVPLLAHALDAGFGHSLAALRLPSALAMATVVVLTGLIARALGAGPAAQTVAGGAVAVSSIALAVGHLLSTSTFDLLMWTTVSLLVVRALGGEPRAWLGAGLAAAVGLNVKTLLAFLLAGILVGLLAVGPRTVFRSPWFWPAAAVAALGWLPNLWWQATHGWPQLQLSRSIAAGGSATSDSWPMFLLLQLGLVSPLLSPVWVAGLVRLARDPSVRPWRCFFVAYVVLAVTFLATGGKAYYLANLYPVLLAAGATPTVAWARRRRLHRGLLVGAFGASAVASTVLFLPVVPASALGATVIPAVNRDAVETIGWPELASTVSAAYRDLAGETGPAAVLTGNYGQAGALRRFAPDVPTYSVHNGLWEHGPPPQDVDAVVALGFDPATLGRWFGEVSQVATIGNLAGVGNEEADRPVFACRERRAPWDVLWGSLRRIG